MQNFDVQHNVACKQSAIGRVAYVFSFVTTGRHIVLCFQRFGQHLDQTLEKAVNELRNIFYPFSYNFVEHFSMLLQWNEYHYQCVKNHYQRIVMHCHRI